MSLKLWFTMLCLIALQFVARSTDSIPDLKYVDEVVDSIGFPQMEIEELTIALVNRWQEDMEKMRSIYRFVITQIAYDVEAYQPGVRRINHSNEDIIRRRKAVCWGYAELIREMCAYADIPCQTITGYVRETQMPRRSYEKANHAWNAVRLDGQWYLLDATWGNALLHGDNSFSLQFGANYFLSAPDIFIRSHYPLMTMWQLLPCPIPYEDFLASSFSTHFDECDYPFQQKIGQFIAQPYYDQQVAIMQEAYEINPTINNRQQVGHALVDVAIAKKESGEKLMEMDSVALAMELFQAAQRIFELAPELCTLYPWQEEAYIGNSANLAQTYYQVYQDDDARQELIIAQFQRLLDQLKVSSQLSIYTREHMQNLAQLYLEILE